MKLFASIAVACLLFPVAAFAQVSKLEYVIQDGSMTVYDINALPTAKVVKTKCPSGK